MASTAGRVLCRSRWHGTFPRPGSWCSAPTQHRDRPPYELPHRGALQPSGEVSATIRLEVNRDTVAPLRAWARPWPRLVSNNRRTRARRRDRCQPPAAQAGLSRPANVAEAAAASTERARWERHIWPRAGSRSSGRGSPTRRHPHRSPPPSPSWARSGPAANPVAVPGEDPADAVLARTMDHARWIGTRWIGTCPSEADPW